MAPPYRLFGTPGSLYTAKARSYLRKQHVDFVELPAASAEFAALIPVIGRWIIPVLTTPAGDVLQDGSVIIDHFEAAGARLSAIPATPVQRAVAAIFELFGGEGLLRPAMHYRWNFDEVNQPFIADDFAAALAPAGAPQELKDKVFGGAARRMRAAMAGFGVTPATIPAVEASYAEFLTLLDAHLAATPYLLGGRPTLGDYGLIGPMFAHLGRDPVPRHMMQRTAWNVFRWTERMNAPEAQADGLGPADGGLFADDAIPATLAALLRFVAEDYLPELTAHVAFANQWLADRRDDISGTSGLANPGDRMIGMASFDWRGHSITTMVMPYRFWLLQKVQAAAAACDDPRLAELLAATGLAPLLALRTTRPVERLGHVEVWGPRQG